MSDELVNILIEDDSESFSIAIDEALESEVVTVEDVSGETVVGPPGPKGDAGPAGIDGKSAYQIWVEQGNVGTPDDFIASLKGEKGDPGDASTIDLSPYATNNDLSSEVAAREAADNNLQSQINNMAPSSGGGIEVAATFAEINTDNTAPRMVIVHADEQNNQGGKSIYAFDGTTLTQLLTL